jgi:thiamine biosynthesis protein ThiI
MDPIIVVHYHEISLKGRNRNFFEKKLLHNIERMLNGIVPSAAVERDYGRMLVRLPADCTASGATATEIQKRLKKVFGIAAQLSIDGITEAAEAILQGREFLSFAVKARRPNKEFPLTSSEVNCLVGTYIKEHFRKTVNLDNPDITVFIEIAFREAYIYTGKISGPGGLPVGVSGKVVSLVSAGFDSPVASYLMTKRGAEVVFVHFHSLPYVSRNSVEQVRELVRVLTQYQFESTLYLVPFADTQKMIVASAPSPLRVILYRRMMLRVAEAIARIEKAEALVTGDNLGQVASQTLRNINVINQVAGLPVFRPLIGEDKEEIISYARRIDTHDISSEPYDDCCSFLATRNPETWANPDDITKAEGLLDIPKLLEELLAKTEKEMITGS